MVEAADPASEAWARLAAINGIGLSMATDIVGFFNEPNNQAVLDDLAGLITVTDFVAPPAPDGAASPFAGKTMVFTGTLTAMTRSEAKARAEALGANVAGAVSSTTDFLVVGADAGSKAAKAQALGVTILSEDEFLARLAG
jgi:DNA ligase (NAD+)